MDKIKCPICNKELNVRGMGRHCKTQHNLDYSEFIKENNTIKIKEVIYDINSNHVCEYGCGNVAKYQLRNGKWCCSKSQNSCNEMKRKNSSINKGILRHESPFVNKEHRYDWTGKHLSDEHKKKISNSNKGNTNYKDLSEDKKVQMKQKLRNNMLNKYKNGFEVRCGRAPKYEYCSPIAGDIKVDGSWELQVAKYLDNQQYNWIRNKRRFDYINEENIYSTYCPDFYIIEFDCYIEVKGYKTKRDDCKWSQFTENLQVWDYAKLKELNIL